MTYRKSIIHTLMFCLATAAMVFLHGCKKDEASSPQYDFTWAEDPMIGIPVQFSSNAPETDEHYWDFGDGQTSTDARPVHTFHYPGENHVSMMVNGDIEHSITKTIWVRQVLAIARGGSVVAGDTTWFKSNADSNVQSYLWNFGDGTTSTLAKPWHIYEKGGVYRVNLWVNDGEQAAALDVNIFDGSDYTHKIGGTRPWHIHKRVDSHNINYTYDTDTSFYITYITRYAVSVANNYFKGYYTYNKGKSTGDVLVFEAAKSTLRYNHVLDTMCIVYEYNMVYDSAHWWKEYIIARTL